MYFTWTTTTSTRVDKGKEKDIATSSTRQASRSLMLSGPSLSVMSLVDDDEMEEDFGGVEDNLGYEEDYE